jgi:hypothetical protein
MIKKLRSTVFAAVVLVTLALPLAADTGLPCYDLWRGCLAGGGGENFCEGVWLGCMERTYGALQ